MFTIKVDGQELYAPALFDERYQVINPELQLEVNKAGSLSFTMPPCNIMWNSIEKLTSIITVEQDGVEIFRGRVMNDETDTYMQRGVYCEGELAFLLDSIQRPYDFEGNAVQLFRQLITTHNECVEEGKRFTIGNITAVDENTEAAIDSNEHSNTFTEINDRLLGAYGGYIRIRHRNGTRYIDYLSKAGNDNTQPIQLGVNLLDLKESISAEDVFTVLIPTGAMQKGSNGRFTEALKISSVNDGLDYIEDAEAVAKYGRIWRSKHWDYIEDPAELKEKGLEYLQTGIAEDATLTITAVDMHFADPNKQRIGIGDMVHILSDPHGLDQVTICTRIVLPLQEPEKTVYTFGEPKKDLTDNVVRVDEATGGGGGGGGRTTEEEVRDVWRWAYAQADEDQATFDILTGEIDNVKGRTSAAEIRLNGVEATIDLKAEKHELDELTGQMEDLETTVTISADGLRQTIQESERTISELQATVDGLDHWITDADGNVSELTNTVRGMQSMVTSVDGRVSTLTNTADGMTSTLSEQGQVLSSFRTRIDEISSAVQDTNGNLGTLVTTSNSVTAKVSNVDGRVSQLAVTADGLTFALSQQGQELTTIKALIDEIGLTVQDTNGALGQLTVQSDRISGKLTDANGKITALMELTDERFTTMLGDIETLEGDVGTIKGSTLWQDRNKIVAAVGEIETMEGDIGTIKGSALWQDRNKIVSAVGKVTTLENNIKTVTGSTLWQDRNKIVAAVGEIETLESDISTLENDISTIKGTALWQDRNNIVAAVGEIETLDGRISTITGSTLWQNRNNITGVVGNMTVDSAGNVVIKQGSGLKINRNGVSYGVFDDNNLTAGLLVNRINGGTATLQGNRVNIKANDDFKAQASAIALKADKAALDLANGRIDAQANAISLKADKIELAGYVTADQLEAEMAAIDNLISGVTEASVLKATMVNCTSALLYKNTAASWKEKTVCTGVNVSQSKNIVRVRDVNGNEVTINYVTSVDVTPTRSTINYIGE